jgi:hypothetical protein
VHSVIKKGRASIKNRTRLEELVVVLTQLDRPDPREDQDVVKVFLQELASDLLTDTRSLKSTIGVDDWVNGDTDVDWHHEGKDVVTDASNYSAFYLRF